MIAGSGQNVRLREGIAQLAGSGMLHFQQIRPDRRNAVIVLKGIENDITIMCY